MALKTHTPNLVSPRLRVKGRNYYRRTFMSLGNPGYRPFWISLVIMMAGVNMQMLARGQLAWELTESYRDVALVGAGFAPPILIFSLFGGALADRWDRKKLVQYGQLIIGCVAFIVGVTIVTDVVNIWILLVAGFAQGMVWAFLMPARQAIIPQLVSKSEVTNAVALSASAMALMTLAGPAMGGVVYALVGPGPTYFIISGMILISFFLTGSMPNVNVAAAKRQQQQVFKAVAEGLRYTSKNRTILFLLLLVMATTMSSMSFRSLMPAFVGDVFQGGSGLLGLLMSMIGVGALTGSLFIAGLTANAKRGVVLLGATALSAIAILISAFVAIILVTVVSMVLLGLGDSGRRSLNASLLMEQSDEEHQGRVMGIYMLNFGLTPLGAIPLGFLAEATNIQLAFGIAGAGLALAVVLVTALTGRIRSL